MTENKYDKRQDLLNQLFQQEEQDQELEFDHDLFSKTVMKKINKEIWLRSLVLSILLIALSAIVLMQAIPLLLTYSSGSSINFSHLFPIDYSQFSLYIFIYPMVLIVVLYNLANN